MKIYLLIIRNRLKYSLDDDLAKLKTWLSSKSPLEIEFEYLDTDLDISYKDFRVKVDGVSLWGIDGLKEKLRGLKIEPNEYHTIFFLYENSSIGKTLGAWTYPNPLYNTDVVIEIPSTALWESQDNLFRMMSHELIHALHRLCWWQGIYTHDTMDLYDKEYDVYAPDGNRSRNLSILDPYWGKIANPPRTRFIKSLMEKLIGLYNLAINLMSIKISRINLWAEAIKQYEGWSTGSRSFRNNNPGNLKYAFQFGTTGKDKGSFAIFNTYEDGWNALVRQLTIAANGKSRVYNPEMSLMNFFEVYAPASDSNEPKSYALFVARKLGVEPTIKIKELL